jgi:hypothetical protein
MGSANDNGAKLWKAIKGYDWATGNAPPVESDPNPTPGGNVEYSKPDIVSRYLAALNSNNANNLAKLYESNGKLFAGNKKYKGRSEIKGFYGNLFNKIMPKAIFSFRTWSWRGYAYKINWKAVSNGKAWSGSDSINLNPANPKLILEHYSAVPTKKSIDHSDIAEEDVESGPIPV